MVRPIPNSDSREAGVLSLTKRSQCNSPKSSTLIHLPGLDSRKIVSSRLVAKVSCLFPGMGLGDADDARSRMQVTSALGIGRRRASTGVRSICRGRGVLLSWVSLNLEGGVGVLVVVRALNSMYLTRASNTLGMRNSSISTWTACPSRWQFLI